MTLKQEILEELDSRILRLENHKDDYKPSHDNQFEEMNHAVSKVIGQALLKEIKSIREFVEES